MAQKHAVSTADGYANHFERRPENDLFGGLIPQVIDATTVRERTVGDLKVFRIPDLFSGRDEIFIGFGRPNAYLVVPNGKGGYQKFAGKSLKRAPSVVEETKDFAQSGLIIRLKGLPPEAAEKIREAMQHFHGQKFWTCVNACMRVMERAGFKSGKRSLTKRYWPYSLFTSLVKDGLTYDGKKVEFEVIRTTPDRTEKYALRIIGAEVTTFCRHTTRNLEVKAKTSKVSRLMLGVINLPSRLIGGGKKKAPHVIAPVAPPLPDAAFESGYQVRVSEANAFGAILRLFWGAHNLFEGTQQRVDVTRYLTGNLKAFPMEKPNLATRLKKAFLFSRPVIKLIRFILAPKYAEVGTRDERDIHSMLRTHSAAQPNKYNLVLLGNQTESRFVLARITSGAKLVDWILSKHVLMSGYAEHVVFAGEIWKDEAGVIHVNRNSGTYQPSEEQLDAVVEFLKALFPHFTIVKDDVL